MGGLSSCKELRHLFSDLMRKQGGHGIAYLMILRSPGAAEEVVVGEGLKSGRFPNGQATHLRGIRVDVVMTILADVGRDRAARAIPTLHLEPIGERRLGIIEISMIGSQRFRQLEDLSVLAELRESGEIRVTR